MSNVADEAMKQAKAELEAEQFRALVDKRKDQIRLQQTRKFRWFPWRLRIERRDEHLPERREDAINRHVRALEKLGCSVSQQYGGFIIRRESSGK